MRHVLKPLVVALCGAVLTFAANAKSFDQAGNAPTQLAPVGTYAAGAPVRASLKNLVPKDWQIMVHRGVQLPATIDWSATDTWPQVLANFAEKSGFAVLVDWDQRSVFLRPSEVAFEDSVRRTQVAQAAVTPLPALAPAAQPQPATPAILVSAQPPVASIDKATVDAMTAKLASLETELGKLTDAKDKGQADTAAALESLRKELDARALALSSAQAELVEAKRAASEARTMADAARGAADEAQAATANLARETAEAVAKAAAQQAEQDAQTAQVLKAAQAAVAAQPAPVVAAAEGFATPHPVAGEYQSLTLGQGFNRAPVHTVAAKVAELHGASLEFRAPADLRFPGPVTVLGADLGEDVRLMLRALGPDAQVTFDLCRNPAYLRVVPAVAGTSAKYTEAACSHPAMHMAAAPTKPAATAAAVSQPAPSASAAAPAFILPGSGAVAPMAPVASAALPAASGSAKTVAVSAAKEAAEPKNASAFKLSLPAGSDLEIGLRQFLKSHGYELKWDSEYEFNAADPLNAEGANLVEVLTHFLPKMGLEAEINTQERIVRVGDERNEVKN